MEEEEEAAEAAAAEEAALEAALAAALAAAVEEVEGAEVAAAVAAAAAEVEARMCIPGMGSSYLLRPTQPSPSCPLRQKSNRAHSGNRAPNSNAGGTSVGGSGPKPSFGGGRYYAGGAATPYRAGGRSPSGILPFAILGGAALAFWPGVWLYGAYMYPYHHPYHYYNESSRRNETRDVLCGCGTYDVCGCDDNNNTAYYDSLIGNGSYDALNKSIVNVADVNGTRTILINGSLPNGTTADGQDSSAAGLRNIVQLMGFWPAVAAVLVAVFLA